MERLHINFNDKEKDVVKEVNKEDLYNIVQELSKNLDNKFDKLIGGVENIHTQIKDIDDNSTKLSANQMMEAIKLDIINMKKDIELLKNNNPNILSNEEKQSKPKNLVLIKTIDFLDVKSKLNEIMEKINKCTISINNTIAKIEDMKNRLSDAKTHMRNVGRALGGKEYLEIKDFSSDKGILSSIQKSLNSITNTLFEIGTTVKSYYDKIDNLKQNSQKQNNEKNPKQENLKQDNKIKDNSKDEQDMSR